MSSKGFTLLEILVAVAVLSIALMAAIRAAAGVTQHVSAVNSRMLASWVAQDRLEEHRARRTWLPVGETNGLAEQGGVRFAWRERVQATPNVFFRRVEVSVMAEGDELPLASLAGFIVSGGI